MADDNRITEADLGGLKYFGRLKALFAILHGAGCERDHARNRKFHYDHYCLLLLLSMFSPTARSVRALQQASELKKVQKRLGVSRFAHGSFSEGPQVFDPQLLLPIIARLDRESRSKLKECGFDPRLADLKQAVTLADGTMLVALPRIAAAAWGGKPTGQRDYAWRLHTQFEVLRGDVYHAELTGPTNGGETSERQVLGRTLEKDRCYVLDRGYQSLELFEHIHALGSSYVCRITEKTTWTETETRALSDEARERGVISDVVATLGAKRRKQGEHSVRVITLQVTPHVKRSGHKGDAGPATSGVLLIATNLLDVPAEIIAILYEYRWHIELFFRFFKQVLGCGHLLSHRREGIEIQAYCAIIACLILSSFIPGRVTKRTHEMLSWYLLGVADEEEMAAHLRKLQSENLKRRTS